MDTEKKRMMKIEPFVVVVVVVVVFVAINLLNSVRMFWNIHFKQRDDLNFLPTHNAYLSGIWYMEFNVHINVRKLINLQFLAFFSLVAKNISGEMM